MKLVLFECQFLRLFMGLYFLIFGGFLGGWGFVCLFVLNE